MAKISQHSPAAPRRELDRQTVQAPIAPMVYTAGDSVGAKRTADGQVKDRSPTSSVAGSYQHSRTLSTASRESQIGEVRDSRSYECE